MSKTILWLITLLFGGLTSLVQAQGKVAFAGDFQLDSRGFQALPITNLPVNDSDEQFQFAIVSDRTGGARTPVFHRALRRLNLLQPEFVVSVGDMIEGYTTDRTTLAGEWDEFNRMIDELTMPYVYTPGNHDYTNDVMADIWRERYGADYYHFRYKNTLFLVLNSEADLKGVGRPGISDRQLQYLSEVLKRNADVRWTLIFMHQPVWRIGETEDWKKLETMLGQRPYTAFAGHMHTYDYTSNQNSRELITLSSTGGVSQLRGRAYGEFDHITWVTMKEDGPVLAHVELDGIFGKYVTSPDFNKAFGKAPVFSMDPWFSRKTGRQRGELLLRAQNPFSRPLSYRFEALADPNYQLLEKLPAGELAPGESSLFRVPLKKLSDGDVEPLALTAYGKVPVDDLDVADWRENMRAQPVLSYTVGAMRRDVTVDGDLREWPKLRFSGGTRGERARFGRSGTLEDVAAQDLSFRFDVRRDEEFLYVAVDVRDDHVTRDFTSLGGGQDSVTVMIDARPVSESARNTGTTKSLKAGHWSVLMTVPNGQGGLMPLADLTPQVFQVKLREHDRGYSAEYAIPQRYLDQKQDGQWHSVRVNVSVADHDQEPISAAPLTLSWQPGWNRAVVGSGTFFRDR